MLTTAAVGAVEENADAVVVVVGVAEMVPVSFSLLHLR